MYNNNLVFNLYLSEFYILFYNFQKPTTKHFNEKESTEKMPFYTTIMAFLGFYCLIFIGLVNHVIFTPKVATERNREVKIVLEIFIIMIVN